MHHFTRFTLQYGSGSLAGLLTACVIWFFGALGWTESYGVRIYPQLTQEWIYPMVIWGGIWGMSFSLPILNKHPLLKGLVMSLGPAFAQLFIVYPILEKRGLLGRQLGEHTWLFILGFSLIWGMTTSLWLKGTRA